MLITLDCIQQVPSFVLHSPPIHTQPLDLTLNDLSAYSEVVDKPQAHQGNNIQNDVKVLRFHGIVTGGGKLYCDLTLTSSQAHINARDHLVVDEKKMGTAKASY